MDLNNPLSSSESSTDSSSDSSSGSSELDAAISKAAILAVNAMFDAVRGDDDDEDDDDDDEVVRPRFKRRVTIVRRRQEDEARLMRNYFVDEPIYNAKMFRRRYRMSKRLFLQICDDLAAEYPFFQQRYDGSGKLGFSTKLKCTSALRQLAYGTSVDTFDENFGIQKEPHGSNNDINVFEASPFLEELISGLAPTTSFYANDNFYKSGYYLGDGIYPEYAIFVKTFTDPIDNKRKLFKKKQELARKDIERAFGVLKKRWKVISNPSRYWDKDKMQSVIYTCIILHNMILQDEDKAFCQDYDPEDPSLDPEYWTQETPMEQRIKNTHAIKSGETHNMLMADLVDQVWTTRSRQDEAVPDLNEYVSDDDA
uniref:uncharacterized protein LOC122609482 n=1 Tax=Erigeron canadensis TaxID=72917 RepID=UPI001CB9D108|nr:uncharacterized protein LOC122609482 [Erigeron canadensis]